MKRPLIFAGICAVALAYILLFTGERSEAGSFSVGNLYITYSISSRGRLPKCLDYAVISDDFPGIGIEYEHEDRQGRGTSGPGARFQFAYRYPDGTVVSSSVGVGQTLWIGKDHKAHVIPTFLGPAAIRCIREHRTNVTEHLSSPHDIEALVAKLKAEPPGAANAAPPHR